jgi:hypothetical protein
MAARIAPGARFATAATIRSAGRYWVFGAIWTRA